MADSFVRVTLRDGSTHTVVPSGGATPEGLVETLAKGQPWPQDNGWIEVEGGGAVARKLVSSREIASVELFERP